MKLSDTILSFDPGETTGISIIEYGDPIINMTVSVRAFHSENFFLGLMKLARPTVIVIEKPPPKGMANEDQEFVYHRVHQWFNIAGVHVATILPGQWKNLIERSKLSSTHMRDAADMGRWYYMTYSLEEQNGV